MEKEVDLLVIGGGASAAVAAALASQKGLQVTLVRKSGGATAYSSGALDIAADFYRPTMQWKECLASIARQRGPHPYARFPMSAANQYDDAVGLFVDLAKDAAITTKADGTNFWVASEMGTIKPCAGVQRSAELDIATLADGALVSVVGVSGLSFLAHEVAKMLAWTTRVALNKEVKTASMVIDFLPQSMRWDSCFSLARDLEDADLQDALRHQFKIAWGKLAQKPSYLLLPPILPMNFAPLLAAFEKESGVVVREMIASPISMPGQRLSCALGEGLSRHQVTCLEGFVRGHRYEDGRVANLSAEVSGETIVFKPKAVILATGKFLGGGIAANGFTRESIFNLPVIAGARAVEDQFTGDLTSPLPWQEQDLFKAGLSCDDQLRPCNLFGEPYAKNLFAAGSIVGGYEAAKEMTGLGAAIWTGALAADYAMRDL